LNSIKIEIEKEEKKEVEICVKSYLNASSKLFKEKKIGKKKLNI